MSTNSKTASYQTLNLQLDEVIEQLQQPTLDIDKALEIYKKGQELISKIEQCLTITDNKIKKLTSEKNT